MTAILATLASAQSLNIPTRLGSTNSLREAMSITGSKDMGNKEYYRGRACDSDEDTGSSNAVFNLEAGATLSNVIIGVNQLEGVHCQGAWTLKNAQATLPSKEAAPQNAADKVIQHNGRGMVTVKDFTVVSVGKLFQSCDNCSKNGGPCNVVVTGLKANGVTSDLVGINSNYGNKATISRSCVNSVKKVCQEYKGIVKGNGDSEKVSTTSSCTGAQGKLTGLLLARWSMIDELKSWTGKTAQEILFLPPWYSIHCT
ncbi:putative pectate lyase E [Lachnellula suecica]|uniref:Pectate lyase n=1 Tax=Lachnellula suecica TaxID=602035 RepID=A0A8T9CHV4_9HELO|nr:putative pectate lyase E [Lachnellula suecica]